MPDLRRMRAAWAAALAAGLLGVTAAPAVAASPAATVTAPSGAATAAKASRAVAKPTSTTAAKTTAKPRAAAASRPRATTQPKATAKPKDTPKGKKPKPKKPKPPAKPVLSGWLAPAAAAFPQRAVTLLTAPHRALSSSALTLTENGAPVTPFTLSPLSQGQPGDFGLDLVVDRSTAMGAPSIDAALAAARQLASARVGAQQLGLIVFAARPAAELPLTSSARRIDLELQANPAPAAGDDLLAAEQLAVDQVQRSGVARGSVLAVADATAVAGQVQALQALHDRAAAAGITVVTVELGAGSGSSAVAGRAAPPAVVPATVATLPAGVASLRQQLTSGYVLRYRSPAGHHAAVDVAVSATGFTGSIHGAYISPAAPPPAPVRHSAAPKHRDTLDLSSATPLSKTPPFVSLPPPPASAPAPTGFWASSAAVPAVALLCALLIAAAVALAVHRPSKSALRERVGDFLPVEAPAYDPSAPAPQRPKGPLRALQRGSWWPPFVEAVAVSRNPRSPAELVRRAAAAGLVVAVLLTVVSGSVLLGLLPLLAWPFVLRALVFRAAEKQRSRFRDTLPVYLQDLGSSIRVGRSLVSALAAVADNADEPTKSEFERAVTDEALGRPLEECLDQISARMDSRDMSQVALIAGLNRKSGANIAESLDRVAEGARERADLHREMKALTAQAKMSSLVLTSLPGVLLVGLSVISPQYAHPLLHTTIGIVALTAGAVLVFSGWKVMKKITNVGAL